MRQVTLNIPEQQYDFFIQLIKNLGYDTNEDFPIPEQHKQLLEQRLKNTKDEDFISWEDARSKFNFKK